MPHPVPTVPSERIQALDTIRGFAVLGILLMNILAFGLPSRAYFDPSVDGALSGADFGIFFVVDLLVEGVMRAVFSMLFGVGIALAASRETRLTGVGIYYRRQFLLLGIGLVDTFVLLWTGDILVSYALAGMVLYLCRNWRPRNLGIAAGCIFAYLAVVYATIFLVLSWGPVHATAVQTRIEAGQAVSAEDQAMLDAWVDLEAAVHPPESIRAREALKFEGSYRQAFVANAEEAGEMYTLVLPLFAIWDAAACMLLGMALYKTGFFQGRRSLRCYVLVAVLGFACGLTVNGFELAMKIGSGYAPQWVSGASVFTNDLGRVSTGPGIRLCGNDRLAVRLVRQTAPSSGGRRAYGAHELHPAKRLRPGDLPRFRARTLERTRPPPAVLHRAGGVGRPDLVQQLVAGSLPVRSAGVAVAVADLRPRPAHDRVMRQKQE